MAAYPDNAQQNFATGQTFGGLPPPAYPHRETGVQELKEQSLKERLEMINAGLADCHQTISAFDGMPKDVGPTSPAVERGAIQLAEEALQQIGFLRSRLASLHSRIGVL